MPMLSESYIPWSNRVLVNGIGIYHAYGPNRQEENCQIFFDSGQACRIERVKSL